WKQDGCELTWIPRLLFASDSIVHRQRPWCPDDPARALGPALLTHRPCRLHAAPRDGRPRALDPGRAGGGLPAADRRLRAARALPAVPRHRLRPCDPVGERRGTGANRPARARARGAVRTLGASLLHRIPCLEP